MLGQLGSAQVPRGYQGSLDLVAAGDVPEDAQHHVDFFHRASLTDDQMALSVRDACPDLAIVTPSATCTRALNAMLTSMGDFTSNTTWNVYDIYSTCSDMPHLTANEGRRTGKAASGEQSATWYCGGDKATSIWMNLPAVQEALHVNTSRAKKPWAPERDLKWQCSNDDTTAQETNFTMCPPGFITDWRPHIKALVHQGFGVLVFSGDVDAQIPHTATEAWIHSLGFEVDVAWHPWLAEMTSLVEGYAVRYERNLTFATIKGAGVSNLCWYASIVDIGFGAGHMVPKYRPAAIKMAIQRYMSSRSLAAPVR